MSEWALHPLGSFAQVVDCEHKTAPAARLGEEYGYSVGTPHIRGGRIDYAAAKRVSRETFEAWSRRAVLRGGDLILAREAPVGQVGRVVADLPTCLGQRTVLVRVDESKVDERFVHAYLLGAQAQRWMQDRSTGSTVAHLNVSDVREIPVALPPLREQRRIAAVLGTIDALIERDRRLSNDLADMAMAVGAAFMASVEGRDLRPLTDYCSVTKGFSYRSPELVEGADTLVNLKNIGRGGTFERRGFKPLTTERYKPQQVLTPGDIVVAMTDLTQKREVVARPVRVPDVSVAGKMIASLDLAIVRPKDGYSREFLAAALSQPAFHAFARNYSNGTTVLHMSARAFDDYLLPAVSPDESHEVSEALSSLYAQQDACMAEIDDLVKMRDELVPLLMSGRVRVRDVEGLVA